MAMLSFLFACTVTASTAIALITTDANIPAISRVAAADQITPSENMPRMYETADMEDEERINWPVIKFENAATASSFSKLALAEFHELVAKPELDIELQAVINTEYFQELIRYCSKYNRGKRREDQISLLDPLFEKYGNEVLQALKMDGNSKISWDAQKHLRTDLLRNWMKKRTPTKDIIDMLNIGDDLNADYDFGNLQFLAGYIKDLYSKEDGNADHMWNFVSDKMLDIMMTGFGGVSNLVPRLTKAEGSLHARRVEEALIRKWQAEELSSDEVLRLLQFSDDVNEALISGKFRMFRSYTSLNGHSHMKEDLQKLVDIFGEFKLFSVLVTAKDYPPTKEFVADLRSQLLQNWVDDRQGVEEIYKKLELKIDDSWSINSSKLEVLSEFINLMKPINRQVGKADVWYLARTVTETLDRKGSRNALEVEAPLMSSEFASGLEQLLFNAWEKKGLEPDDLYDELNTDFERNFDSLDTTIAFRYEAYLGLEKSRILNFDDPRRS